jgi:hypothetical protein
MHSSGLLFNSSDFNSESESNLFGIGKGRGRGPFFSGRKKACKDAGLSGAEKRKCAQQLRASGWKKGMPIPASMGGVTPAEVEAAPAPPPSAPVVPLVDSVAVDAAPAAPAGVEQPAPAPDASEKAPAEKSKTMMYVIIGVVLLIVIIAAVVMMRKKAA